MSSALAKPTYADRLEQASSSRRQAITHSFGTQPFALTSLMGPIDGPQWPSDAAWLALAHEDCACIVSDGLSDPWVEPNRLEPGLGLEVFVQSPDVVFQEDTPMAVADTWLFPMTAEISHTLASYPRLCSKLLSGEPLCLRFNIEHIKDGRGLVGTLLHIPPAYAQIELAHGTIALVAATLLHVDELRWLVGKKAAGRRELLAQLDELGIAGRSLAQRNPVVSP